MLTKYITGFNTQNFAFLLQSVFVNAVWLSEKQRLYSYKQWLDKFL